MIAQEVERWLRLRRHGNLHPLGVVLHTGCLNYETEQLQKLIRFGCKLILPNNVSWEIRLLTGSKSVYGRKAKALLSIEGLHHATWDLEQLYLADLDDMRRKDLHDGPMLFLFGDLNKQDEFLQNVCPMEYCHILIHTDWESHKRPVICTLNSVRKCSYRNPIPLSTLQPASELSRISRIHCIYSGSSTIVSGNEFQLTGMGGTYSQIYTHDSYPGRYFKIYRNTAHIGTSAAKLRILAQYVRAKPMTFAAFPESLLVTDDDRILGYGMPIHQGHPLSTYCDNGWMGKTSAQIGSIIEDLLMLLLEMHLQGFLVNDLSYNNILVCRNHTVRFVDSDSVQFRDYPGGMITDIYRHPQISNDSAQEHLRQPRHEYFALAVLLFQCYLFTDPLYAEDANWNDHRFTLGENLDSVANENEDLWENWKALPPVLRRMFSDVFLFRRDYSIGAWYRGLNEE